ncbi:DUF1295-domain-containing protein [Athelia psychrophila]|uniref:DUF1295-domain-containing protein n=1 Tax=Athelia psychrophila TaxID=1759441 RepID=A0A167ULF5_9AGAM|nr:DUF1295-domain-containing protein [Fibularhizoctonia sp. CBS 109695]
MSENKSKVKDLSRVPGSSPYGHAMWYLGRAADAPFQYLLFSRGFAVSTASALGLRASNVLVKAGPGAGGLGPVPTLLTGLYALAALRHVYWLTFTNTYEFPFGQAVQVVLYNLVVDTFITISAVQALATTSNVPDLTNLDGSGFGSFVDALGWKQWTGIGMFVVGLLIESLSEELRKSFKNDPKNKGKIVDAGLWSLVRHPNYSGHTIWRSGIALATGSIGATVGFALFQAGVLLGQSIPGLAGHMAARYGAQWTAYEKRVTYKLVPGIL